MIDQAIVIIPNVSLGLLAGRSMGWLHAETEHQLFLRYAETSWAMAGVLIVIAIGALQAYLLITRGQTVWKCILSFGHGERSLCVQLGPPGTS